MKKLLVPLVILLTLVLSITACSSTSTTTPAATTPSATTSAATVPSASSPVATKPASTSLAPLTTTPVSGTTAKYGGTIKWIDPTSPGTPLGVPWQSNFPSGSMQLSLEPLLKEQLDGTLLPRLATSYEVDSNLKTPSITFHLRKGVKFHDGTDFNAQAVKWNLDNQMKESLFSSPRYWKSIDIIDDYTVKIPLTMWRNSLMPSFAANMVYMVSPTAFQKNGVDWMRWNMVGTGPYKHVDFKRDMSVTTEKNSGYWNSGQPYLDGVQYLFVADELTRVALFKSGGGDILNTNRNGRVSSELQASGYKILTQPTGVSTLFMDNANASSPWSNIKVRQAADYAIDKEAIAKTFGYGFWQAAYQFPNPTSKAYIPSIPGRKYDVAKAKQLLTEAGYPTGFKSKIIAQNTVNKDIIVTLQSYLSKVGITDLEFPEPAKFTTYQNGTWNNAMIYSETSQSPNFNQSFGFSFAAPRTNYMSTKNPDGWTDLMTETMNAPEADPKIMQKLVQVLYDDCTVIKVAYQTDMCVIKNNLQDSGIGTRGGSIYWNPDDAWWSK